MSKQKWKPYAEKLRDPRWQKKRLEVMERDGFTCQNCGDKESTLNVHHWYYAAGNDPWDYPDEALATLCEDCHDTIESLKVRFLSSLAESDWGNGYEEQIRLAIGLVNGYSCRSPLNRTVQVNTTDELIGFCKGWEVEPNLDILDFIDAFEFDGIIAGHEQGEDDDSLKKWIISSSGFAHLESAWVDDLAEKTLRPKTKRGDGQFYAGWWL